MRSDHTSSVLQRLLAAAVPLAMLPAAVLFVAMLNGCDSERGFSLDFEKYTLDNGLEVVLHKDRSDPLVGVAILYHVGSNREVPGKTGFAHLFEHMMFQESQHIGQDQFFLKIQGAGGTLNGGTWEDGTIYYEVVPRNTLEMALWMESDRMGFLLSTVTPEALRNQQEVVQNEKRQRVDNRPYGRTSYVINKLLYPAGHPYNWQVIGSLDDLRRASLADVHEFYRKWYGPNNATLVVAGDFDDQKTKEWIEKYFGEIKPIERAEDPVPKPVKLEVAQRVYFEDDFARSPELNMVFPTVEQYTKDIYALTMLGQLLADGKKAPLYSVIVKEKKLAPSVSANQSSLELAGVFRIRVRAFPEQNLGDVEQAVKEGLARFEKEKFTDKDLDRIKAKAETRFYQRISSVLGKCFQLAIFNEYAGSPDYIVTERQRILSVTKDDILRVYGQYVKDKPYVLTSCVPRGKAVLSAADSREFTIPADDANIRAPEGAVVSMDTIPSSFDRSKEPPQGPDPLLNLPAVWDANLDNGMRVLGIEHTELPLVQFQVTLRGGTLGEDPAHAGAANLLARLMTEGTKNRTPVELEEAIDGLGASIRMYASKEAVTLTASCLASRFAETYALAEEILLQPRWDEKEFERLKKEVVEQIRRNRANPAVIAGNVFNRLVYGSDNPLGRSVLGTTESVSAMTLDDLKTYYDRNFSPSVAHVAVVGDVSKPDALSTFSSLSRKWEVKDVDLPEPTMPAMPERPTLYFVDFPGAKQSEIRIGYLALAYTDPDFYPAYVMNYKLGSSFNSIVNMILREEKGYTYGARTGFSASRYPGTFTARAGVQTDATFESVKIFRDEMLKYREGISAEDMDLTRNALLKSNARRFETLGALLSMLNTIAAYDLPLDYVKRQEEVIRKMTVERHRELAQKYIDPERMVYLVVGDAATQLASLKRLGLGTPVMLTADGVRLKGRERL